MQTPDTLAGELTDRIMMKVRQEINGPAEFVTIEKYNRLWSYILALLSGIPALDAEEGRKNAKA